MLVVFIIISGTELFGSEPVAQCRGLNCKFMLPWKVDERGALLVVGLQVYCVVMLGKQFLQLIIG